MLPLTDFDELRALLRLQKDDIEDYPDLAAIIRSVYAAMESYTGRAFERMRRTERVMMTGGQIVTLRALPVAAVTSVTFGGTSLAYTVQSDGLRLGARASGEVAVIYTGGYAEAPEDLRRAATLQVLHEYQRKDHIGAESVSNEGGFTRWPQLGLLDEVKRLLAPYVHPARFC